MAKDSFVFYREWLPLVNTLPDASRLKFFDMMCVYESGEFPVTGDPHLDGVVQFVFTKVAENNKKYAKKCEKAAESAKMRWDANAYERKEAHATATDGNANTKNAMLNDNDNVYVNESNITPISPSSPDGQEGADKKRSRRKSKIETTLDAAKVFYKSQVEEATLLAPAAAEKYKKLAYEICGMRTLDCPEGMVKTIMRLPEQLYFDQYENLCKIMGGHDMLRTILVQMHNNYDEYLTKRKSVNLVAQDWYKNYLKREAKVASSPHKQFSGNVISTPKVVSQ